MEQNLKGLIGTELSGFRVEEHLEIYEKDESGLKTKTLGFIPKKHLKLIEAYVKQTNHIAFATVICAVNGETVFTMNAPSKFIPVKEIVEKVETNIKEKLSPEELVWISSR